MLRLAIEPKPISLCCTITISRSLLKSLSLNCYNSGTSSNKVSYTPSQEDLRKLIRYVKEAPSSQFDFSCLREGKFGESNFAEVLKTYNDTHTDKLDWDSLVDAVKSIDLSHYVGSKVSQKTKYPTKYDNGIFHEWRLPLAVLFSDTSTVDESIPGSKKQRDKDALYIKLFVEDEPNQTGHKVYYTEPDNVQVASIHRNSDSKFFGNNEQKDEQQQRTLGKSRYIAEQKKKAADATRSFKSKEKAHDEQIAKRVLADIDETTDEPELAED